MHKRDVQSMGDVQWGHVYPKPLQIDIQQNNANKAFVYHKMIYIYIDNKFNKPFDI